MTNKPRGLLLFIVLVLFLAVPQLSFAQTDTTVTDATGTVTTTETETALTETITSDTTATEQTTTYYEDDADDTTDEREGALACGLCATFGLAIPLIGLLISLGIAWWIYKDATRRGNPQAVLWAVLGFFFNLLGLIIYLVARPKGPPTTGTTGTSVPPPPRV